MKNARKTAFFLILCISLLLCSCQKKATYTDTLSAAELAEEAIDSLGGTPLLAAEKGYLDDYILIPEGMTDHEIRFSPDGNNLDEIGIWHVASSDTAQMKSLLEEYLQRSLERNRTFYDSYIPQETAKLRDAEVRVFGNYVVYAIMNQSDREAFFASVKNTLQEDE